MTRWPTLALAVLPIAAHAQQNTAPTFSNDPFSAVSAAAFLDSIGVNIHMGYDSAHGWGDDAYNNFDAVEKALAYLGVRWARDTFAYTYYLDKLEQLNRDIGIRFDLCAGTGPNVDFNAGIAWVKAHASIVGAVEGVNEPDNWPAIFGGQVGPGAAVAEQNALYSAMQGTGLPVYNMSIGNPADLGQIGNLSNATDFSTAHTYPAGGQQPGSFIPDWLAKSSTDAPGKPPVQTEAGYSTTPMQSPNGSVSPAVQAKETLNLLFDSYFLNSVYRTHIYELVDEQADPGGTDRENHFGLFNHDWTPKPAADALHNLIAILNDKADTQAGRFTYTTQGLSGRTVLMRKQDGTFIIAAWAEPTIWDGSHEIGAPTQQVTLTFGETADTIQVFDPLTSSKPTASQGAGNKVTIEVTDHPILVAINGPNGTTTAGLPIPTPEPVVQAPASTGPTTTTQPVRAAQGGTPGVMAPLPPRGAQDTAMAPAGADQSTPHDNTPTSALSENHTDATALPSVAAQSINWEALAERVTAYHEATGAWGMLDDWLSQAPPDGGSTDYLTDQKGRR